MSNIKIESGQLASIGQSYKPAFIGDLGKAFESISLQSADGKHVRINNVVVTHRVEDALMIGGLSRKENLEIHFVKIGKGEKGCNLIFAIRTDSGIYSDEKELKKFLSEYKGKGAVINIGLVFSLGMSIFSLISFPLSVVLPGMLFLTFCITYSKYMVPFNEYSNGEVLMRHLEQCGFSKDSFSQREY